jgi:DNA-binding NtrC family response regulator
LPPLRERGDDLILLANYFLERLTHKYSLCARRFSDSALQALRKYRWPGNVRELAHLVERALLVCDEREIGPAALGLDIAFPMIASRRQSDPADIDETLEIRIPERGIDLEEVERELIKQALDLTDGNVAEAARKLHIGREALRYRIQKYGIVRPVS